MQRQFAEIAAERQRVAIIREQADADEQKLLSKQQTLEAAWGQAQSSHANIVAAVQRIVDQEEQQLDAVVQCESQLALEKEAVEKEAQRASLVDAPTALLTQ